MLKDFDVSCVNLIFLIFQINILDIVLQKLEFSAVFQEFAVLSR